MTIAATKTTNSTMGDTTTIAFTVSNARPVSSKHLIALVDVTMTIGGVDIAIHGIQTRTKPNGDTAVCTPTYKDPASGRWLPVIKLPPECETPLANAVLDYLVEQGICRERYGGIIGSKSST